MEINQETKSIEKGILDIRKRITKMSTIVEAMISTCFEAFLSTDKDLAYATIYKDDEVDQLEIEIDQMCMDLIGQPQPTEENVRFIAVAMKQVTDLERIADMCVNICEKTIESNDESTFHTISGLKSMVKEVIDMLHDALKAFISGDHVAAASIPSRDCVIDAYYLQIYLQLLDWMASDSRSVGIATRIQAVINNLERIGDLSTNIAERVIFMVTGTDVRHQDKHKPVGDEPPAGILFLCMHNNSSSQMAEGLAHRLLPDTVNIYSAGSKPAVKVHPIAVEVMRDMGIDISGYRTKRIPYVPLGKVDMVINLSADEIHLNLPRQMKRLSWSLPDPAETNGDEDSVRRAFKEIMDALQGKIRLLAKTLY